MQALDVPTLFAPPQREEPARVAGPFAAVALEQGIDRLLDYSIPPRLVPLLKPGQRVRVPLGKNNRPVPGYVVCLRDTTHHPSVKRIFAIEDERELVGPKLLDLARWMSRYYCAPLGAVLEAVVPAAVRKKIGVGYSQIVRPLLGREALQSL